MPMLVEMGFLTSRETISAICVLVGLQNKRLQNPGACILNDSASARLVPYWVLSEQGNPHQGHTKWELKN